MKKLAVVSAAALVALASVGYTEAEARDGRRTAAVVGAIGGLAAGAFIANSLSNGYAAPRYSYGPSYGSSYGYAPRYAPVYAPAYETRVVRSHAYFDDRPVCRVKVTRHYNTWGERVTRRTEVCG